MALVGLSLSQAMSSSGMPIILTLLFGIGAIVFFPIFYGIMGFVMGIISAVLYNFVSSKIGGLEFEVEK